MSLPVLPDAPEVVYDNSGKVPLKIPGFGGRAVTEQLPEDQHFTTGHTHYLEDVGWNRLTVREVAMIQLMEALTDKPDWERKIKDPTIVRRWKAEALANVPLMSKAAFDWCMLEMADKAVTLRDKKLITTLDHEGPIVKSDALVTPDLVDELKRATQPLLEREPKDWHPGSNEQVLNLVHPSLYPFVYGKTRILSEGAVGLEDCYRWTGQGEVLDVPEPSTRRSWRGDNVVIHSNRFQWLPCEVAFKGTDGTDVEITSYINNLPPTPANKGLYRVIEKAISLSIEPWNQALMYGGKPRAPIRVPCKHIDCGPDVGDYEDFNYLYHDFAREEEPLDEQGFAQLLDQAREQWNETPDNPLTERLIDYPEGLDKDSTFDEVYARLGLEDTMLLKHRRSRKIVVPQAGDAAVYRRWRESPERYSVSLEQTFRQQGLQIIVKLASIELTPEKPSYPGGSWHLEGLLHEHIAATSILYYDVDNVTPSRIDFRHEAHLADADVDQDDHDPWHVVFGSGSVADDDRCLQDLGSVATPQGRLLAFPNTLQHRVEPFELQDKTKPGHRRLLVLWLVDPVYRIASTRNVPPQQQDIWQDALSSLSKRLPAELLAKVDENVDWLMSEEEAKAFRLELMADRTNATKDFHENTPHYNFCEH